MNYPGDRVERQDDHGPYSEAQRGTEYTIKRRREGFNGLADRINDRVVP